MKKWTGMLAQQRESAAAFLRWGVIACAAGLLIGGAGTLFYYSVKWAAAFRAVHPWLIWLLPAGGLLTVFLYRKSGVEKPRGTNLVLLSIRSGEELPFRMAPLIFVCTTVTQLFGGSAGREGAALQLGGSLGYQMGKCLRLDEKDEHIMVMCGMSAAFSALFGTPLTAAVFAMEVTSVGVMYYAALVPCVFASLLASRVALYFGAAPLTFPLSAVPQAGLADMARVTALAVLCAGVSILFCVVNERAEKGYRRYIHNQYIRIAVGGALVAVFALIVGSQDYLGAEGGVLRRTMTGVTRPEAFALKTLFTGLTLGAGYKGGEIVPALFVGATFGNTFGALLGLSPSFGAAVGLTAVFCGVTNCPVTSFILALELFGMDGAAFYLIAAAVSYMLSGYFGLYSKQRVLYSKTKAEFIGRTDQ